MKPGKQVKAKDRCDPDDAPDLSAQKWKKKLAATPVKRGRPKLEVTKVSTTIRLDADVLAKFRAQGPKWQSRMNDALRAWLKSA
jgi:uncharacterized protein (DUF4415 family)